MIVNIGGHEIINVDNYHILGSRLDLWKSAEERRVMYQQGVIEDDGGMSLEVLRYRFDVGDKDETKVKEKRLAGVYDYRPISILPNVSKVFERCIYKQINEHFEKILSKYQCGFRKGFSTQHCLLLMLERFKITLEKKDLMRIC